MAQVTTPQDRNLRGARYWVLGIVSFLVISFLAVLLSQRQSDAPSSGPTIAEPTSSPTVAKQTALVFDAAYDDNWSLVQKLIAEGADVNATTGPPGQTALHRAVMRGQGSIAVALLKAGASVDPVTEDGDTPLHFAAEFNQPETAAILIASGANVDARERLNRQPLHFAAEKGSPQLIDLLIQHGASVNSDSYFGTPLMIAAKSNNFAVVQLLLNKGANPLARRPEDGKTAIIIAGENNSRESFEAILKFTKEHWR